jgi:hypothetical protein
MSLIKSLNSFSGRAIFVKSSFKWWTGKWRPSDDTEMYEQISEFFFKEMINISAL